MQLWLCDWLLELRTVLWQELGGETGQTAVSTFLASFQGDLARLRQLSQYIPVIIDNLLC